MLVFVVLRLVNERSENSMHLSIFPARLASPSLFPQLSTPTLSRSSSSLSMLNHTHAMVSCVSALSCCAVPTVLGVSTCMHSFDGVFRQFESWWASFTSGVAFVVDATN